jgi:hypothetical protein
MHNIKRLGLSAVSLAAALCCAPLASAATPTVGAAGPLSSHDKEEVLHLTSRVTALNGVDVPPPGNSLGDELIIAGDLLRSNVTVGRFGEVCTVTRTSGPTGPRDLQCQITLVLSDGQITVQGVFTLSSSGPGDITLAITGGTGRYRTAQGFVHAVNASATDTQLTVHLIR